RIFFIATVVFAVTSFINSKDDNNSINKDSVEMVVIDDEEVPCIAAIRSDNLNLVSYEIPQEADEYARRIAPGMLEGVKGSETLFGVSICNYDELYLGTPYTICDKDNMDEKKDIYYYPVYENDEIKLVLSVYRKDDKWNATIGKDIAQELNILASKADENYYLYYSKGTIYAEASKACFDNTADNTLTETSKGSNINSATEKSSSKVVIKKNNLKEKANGIIDSISSMFTAKPSIEVFGDYIVKDDNRTILDTTDCLVTQLDKQGNSRGMCWAASVATIVRYVKGDYTITAESVCEKMNIDLDEGGDMELKDKALDAYGLDYSKAYGQLTWEQVKENLDNKKPIAISCFSENEGHAVTILGYTEVDGIRTVLFWNSGNQKMQSATYSDEGTVFSYNSYTWEWSASLY
nr:C39 family peptidase [Lachnospiraceae bacterium]